MKTIHNTIVTLYDYYSLVLIVSFTHGYSLRRKQRNDHVVLFVTLRLEVHFLFKYNSFQWLTPIVFGFLPLFFIVLDWDNWWKKGTLSCTFLAVLNWCLIKYSGSSLFALRTSFWIIQCTFFQMSSFILKVQHRPETIS